MSRVPEEKVAAAAERGVAAWEIILPPGLEAGLEVEDSDVCVWVDPLVG